MARLPVRSAVLAALAAALFLSACGKKAPLDVPPPREEEERSEILPWQPVA